MQACPVNFDEVIDFWFLPENADKWFASDPAFDAQIKKRFSALYEAAGSGACDDWEQTPRGALALVIVLDQFSRNINRGSAAAFAQDDKAREAARRAIAHGFDMQLVESERRWFYMPFMHSEDIEDQRLSVRFFEERLNDPESAAFAKEHFEVISLFGRFPHRNAVLKRTNTAEENEYLKTSTGWGQ